MDVMRVLRKGSLVVGASALAACGGGGGGSAGSDSAVALSCELPDIPVYELTLDPNDFENKTIQISGAEDVGNMLGIYSDVEAGFDLIEDVRTVLSNQNGDQLVCENDGTATLSVSGSGSNADERWLFNDCLVTTPDSDQVILTGTYQSGEAITDQTGEWQKREGYEIYNDLSGVLVDSEGTRSFRIEGRSSLVFEVELGTDNGCVTEKVAGLEFEVGESYVALKDSNTSLKRIGSTTEIRIGGTLIGSSVGGYLKVSTPDPLVFVEPQNCPREGIISVSSEGEAQVLYGDSAGGTATGVAVWINGQTVQSSDDCQSVRVAPLY
ncbi:MAG: hypothetical protein HUJ18_08735 [Marinobacter sp.]|nr:hypothetical protein [Marinobacter sp.]